MHTTLKEFTLNNKTKMPSIGFGTYKALDTVATKSIVDAIATGYRHIDTAAIYENEKAIGKGIIQSGINREQLFVTSKLWNAERGYKTTLRAFEKTLEDLQLSFLDLYLIHWPADAHQFENWEELNAETWRAFEELYNEGKIKAIGLSNFFPKHIEALEKVATIPPMVNQLEFHPGYMQKEAVEYCKQKDILVQAWSPLGRESIFNSKELKEIASKYTKSIAQICIRWALQHHISPLPKTITPLRMKENLAVFDFEISKEDMQLIDKLSTMGFSGMHPETVLF